MTMKKEWRAELRLLKNEKREIEREQVAQHRFLYKSETKLTRDYKRQRAEFNREHNRINKYAARSLSGIAKRISILTGRLAS